jgi:ABC-type antimicrobial peptide transport system permease subunit
VTQGRDGAQYFPVAQTEDLVFIRNVTFVVRTSRTAPDLTPSLRAIAHQLNPVVALRDIRSMDDAATASIADSRFEARLLAIFAALALLLAAVGTYGVAAYDVAARTHELGVRVALGAVSGDVVQVVVSRTLALVIPGLVLGLIGALAITRVLQKSLFEVTPTDPATLVAVSGPCCSTRDWSMKSCCAFIRSGWAGANAFFRTVSTRASSISSAQRLRPRACS